MLMILITILVGALATFIWRFFAAAIAGHINDENPLYEWFSHVSYASAAAILVQNLLSSDGSLPLDEVITRVFAVLIGIIICGMRSNRVFHGLIAALLVYVVCDYSDIVTYLIFELWGMK